MTRTGEKTAFVFAGGGSLGAIQVGMLRVLLAAGVQPDFVIGSSAGAINAGYFAGAPNEEGVERLANIWSGLRGRDVFPFTFTSALGLLRHPGHFTDSIGLRRLIETNLPYKLLEDAVNPVHVTATDVEGVAVVEGTRARRNHGKRRDTGHLPACSHRWPLAHGRRYRRQHAHQGGGGPWSVTDRRASNGICLRLERAPQKSDRQGVARNHFVDRVATHP